MTIVSDEGEAEVLCGLLRSEAIPCFHPVTDGAAQAFVSSGGWHEVLVDEMHLPRARELLAAADLDGSCAGLGVVVAVLALLSALSEWQWRRFRRAAAATRRLANR